MESTFTQTGEMEALRQHCAELERELEQLRQNQRKRLAIAAEVHRSLLPDDPSDVSAHVFRTVRQYQHGPTTDDQTLVVAEIR